MKKEDLKELYEHPVYIGILGERKVGKTSFIQRYISNEFSDEYNTTAGNTSYISDYEAENQVHIYDIVDSSDINLIMKMNIIVCLYDLTDLNSKNAILEKKKEIEAIAKEKEFTIGFILIGTKLDLIEKKNEELKTKEERNTFLRENSFIEEFEVSSKTGEEIVNTFIYVIEAATVWLILRTNKEKKNEFCIDKHSNEYIDKKFNLIMNEDIELISNTVKQDVESEMIHTWNNIEHFRTNLQNAIKDLEKKIKVIDSNLYQIIKETKDEDKIISIMKYRDFLIYLKDYLLKEDSHNAITELESALIGKMFSKTKDIYDSAGKQFDSYLEQICLIHNIDYNSLYNKHDYYLSRFIGEYLE